MGGHHPSPKLRNHVLLSRRKNQFLFFFFHFIFVCPWHLTIRPPRDRAFVSMVHYFCCCCCSDTNHYTLNGRNESKVKKFISTKYRPDFGCICSRKSTGNFINNDRVHCLVVLIASDHFCLYSRYLCYFYSFATTQLGRVFYYWKRLLYWCKHRS